MRFDLPLTVAVSSVRREEWKEDIRGQGWVVGMGGNVNTVTDECNKKSYLTT